MAMKAMTVLFSVITIWVVGNVQSATAPAPAVDCSTLVLNMADCLSYVTNGSTVNKPEGSCCSGLKTVLKTGAECLCEAFKNSAQLGVSLNVTKAMALPKACHVSAPSATNCGASLSAGGAPAASPVAAVSPSSPTPAVAGENEMAPAPAPGIGSTAAAPRLVTSIGSFVLALAVATFFSSI